MSYKSPIEVIMSDIHMKVEGEIYKAVQRAGVDVDKEELIKALRYDRGQYQKGYSDRDAEIIRCKDCQKQGSYDCHITSLTGQTSSDDWFCADGEQG